MAEINLAVIKGDGIGPEVITEAMKTLEVVGEKFGHKFNFTEVLAGGCAIDATGQCLPEETVEVCKKSDSVLLGAVGGPKWDNVAGDQRPERALLGLREKLGLYANLRPAIIHRALSDASPIKKEIVGDSLDIMIVRELTGGIYFGDRGYREGKYGNEAYDTESYSELEVKRIAKIAFEAAMSRSKRLTSVDKANVMESSRLWRKVVTEMAKDYPEVEL
ncbi:MAG: isocitrate/isopropylmalate family dehydrogenase, partial [Anaerotignaceae bacterium]